LQNEKQLVKSFLTDANEQFFKLRVTIIHGYLVRDDVLTVVE